MEKCFQYSFRCLNGPQPYKSQCFRLYHSEKLTVRLLGASHSGVSDTISEMYSPTALNQSSQIKWALFVLSHTHQDQSLCFMEIACAKVLRWLLPKTSFMPWWGATYTRFLNPTRCQTDRWKNSICKKSASVQNWWFVCLRSFICFIHSFYHKFFHCNSHNHTDIQKDAYISCHCNGGNCKISAWHKFEMNKVVKNIRELMVTWVQRGPLTLTKSTKSNNVLSTVLFKCRAEF